MKEKDTLIIGRLTEAKVLQYFTELGYVVSLPFGGQARYDYLIDVNGKIIRVHVKTSQLKEGCIYFSTSSSHYIQGHHLHTEYTKDDIDYFVTEYQNQYYMIPVEECGRAKRLRIEVPKKGANLNKINWAKDYQAEEILKHI